MGKFTLTIITRINKEVVIDKSGWQINCIKWQKYEISLVLGHKGLEKG